MIRLPKAPQSTDRCTGMDVVLRVQTELTIRPHLILDVTFPLAITFTFGSAIWVINGASIFAK